MTTPIQSNGVETPRLPARLLAAVLVGVVTYLAWILLWMLGSVGFGIASLFSRQPAPTPVRFGDHWQWTIVATALVLMMSLLFEWKGGRILALVWFGSLIVLAAVGIVAFGIGWGVPVSFLLISPLLVWLLRKMQRAA